MIEIKCKTCGISIVLLLLTIINIGLVLGMDSQTITIMGGDEETLILAVGDLENSPIGTSVYTAPTITPPQGGSGGVSRFDTKFVCSRVRDFLTIGNVTDEAIKLLSLNIENETDIFIANSVLNHYIDNFKYVCNITLDEPIEEVEQKKGQPFLLFFILFLIIFVAIINMNKKIKKIVLAFFKGN